MLARPFVRRVKGEKDREKKTKDCVMLQASKAFFFHVPPLRVNLLVSLDASSPSVLSVPLHLEPVREWRQKKKKKSGG
jgi:hypothetical protein